MARRQLEYEARQLREVMQQRLGAADDMGDRHEARMQRLCLIEREMQRLQQRRERLERDAQVLVHARVYENLKLFTSCVMY